MPDFERAFLGRWIGMKKLICDRCKKEFSPEIDFDHTLGFEYRVRYILYGTFQNRNVLLDLCDSCQKDLDRFFTEKIGKGGETQ